MHVNRFESNLNLWVKDEFVTGNKEKAAKRIKKAFEEKRTFLKLNGLSLNTLPSCIGELKNLKFLDLSINHLTFLPEELGELSDLCVVALDYNRSLATLPETLGKISSLQSILTGGTGISDKKTKEILTRNRSLAIQERMIEERNKFDKSTLLFSNRPEKIQEKIDETHHQLMRQGKDWLHSGTIGFYYLLNFDDTEVIAQRIENASLKKTDLYFIDLGAGCFSWVDSTARFLQRYYSTDKRRFHVIGVTGEGCPFDHKNEEGNVITHKISGFKLENLLESFAEFNFDFVNSVEYIVSSWTLQHLVDPLGTLEQAYNLLCCGNGFLFATGFHDNNLAALLSASFGHYHYITRKGGQGRESFALFRPSEGYISRGASYFKYDDIHPLITLNSEYDSYANCVANLRKKQIHNHLGFDIGGQFHLSDYGVLRELLGEEEKQFRDGATRYNVPLFPLENCSLVDNYLNSFGSYKVYLREEKKNHLG